MRIEWMSVVAMLLVACADDVETAAGATSALDATSVDAGARGVDGGAPTDANMARGESDAQSIDDAGDHDATWAVGVITVETTGAAGRALPTEIWYPIKPGTKGAPARYLSGLVASPYGAIRDAPAAPGSFPLVAFSHGNQGVRDQSVFLTEGLARKGYVVVSPAHVGNTTLDFDAALAGVMVLWRPQDLRAAIDRLAKPQSGDPAWLKGLADTSKVAVTGHSFGGYTSLAVAGIAVGVPQGVTVNCATSGNDPLCKEQATLGAPPWDFKDSRVKVAIPLAHAMYGYKVLQPASAKKLNTPVLIMAATADAVTPYATEALPLYNDLTSPRALFSIQGGGHMSFANICEVGPFAPANLKAQINKLCGPTAKPTMAKTHAAILDYALAACDIYLKGRDKPRALFKNKDKGVSFYTLQSEGISEP